MSSSTTLLDVLTANAQQETNANSLFNSASPSMLFARRESSSTGLTWGYYGGMLLVDGVHTAIANSTVALSASTTNYIEATRAGVVSKNTTAYTPGSIPLYTVVTGASTVTSYTDHRAPVQYLTHEASIAITTADVTATAAQARARRITTTGVLTGDRALILPLRGEWIINCTNSGAYTTTAKTAAGTGIIIAQGMHAIVWGDGVNIVRITPDA